VQSQPERGARVRSYTQSLPPVWAAGRSAVQDSICLMAMPNAAAAVVCRMSALSAVSA
jgi:hypothetical protein